MRIEKVLGIPTDLGIRPRASWNFARARGC